MDRKMLIGLAAAGLLGSVVVAADPPKPKAAEATPAAKAKQPDPNRKIVRWPGGWMYLDAPGVIYHDDSAPKGGSLNLITDSANGVGNSIVIDGATKGTTILRNARNGIGNTITVTPKGPIIDVKPKK